MRKIMTMAMAMLSLTTIHAKRTVDMVAADEALQLSLRGNQFLKNKWNAPPAPRLARRVRPNNLWTRGVYYEGLMALKNIDRASGNTERYINYIDTWGTFHKWTPRNGVTTRHADDQCCTQTYLERYNEAGGKEKVERVKETFDNQMLTGSNHDWTWIDAIQMAMPAYAQLAEITGERKYMDYAMQSYVWARDTLGGGLFNKQEGLWWRDVNFVPPYKESDGKNCYWSRGNGWVFAAYVRVMNTLPAKDKYHKALKKDFITMAKALVPLQREDGFWNASLASQDFAGKELTGTALFLYGIAWGIQRGYLDAKTYEPVADKAWKAIASCIHKDGFVGYVQGTGDRPASSQPVTYVKEPDFDDYGLGCFLLGAAEYHLLKAGLSYERTVRKWGN